MCFIWGSRKLALILKSKTRKTRKYFHKVNFKGFVLFEEFGNFWGFRVFDFGSYTEIENSENSQIFLKLVNFKEWVLFQEEGNFRGFRVFDFGLYAEIENSKNPEIFPRHVNSKECVLLEEVENVQDFWVLIMKLKTQKIRQISIGLL